MNSWPGLSSACRCARLQALPLLLGLCASLGLATVVHATDPEATPPPHLAVLDWTHVHNIGKVACLVTNFGQVGSSPRSSFPFSALPSMEWPRGSGIEYLYSGGLWVGAVRNGTPAVTTATSPAEYRPGLSELDRIYVAAEGQAAGRRYPAADADDDADGHVDEDWPNGRDDDGDGRVDEDFAAISEQMFACAYSDTDPSIQLTWPEHVPLGFKVQQTSLAWSKRLLDGFIAFDYLLVNESDEPLYDVYAAFFADCDIGQRDRADVATDDHAGFWEGILVARLPEGDRNVRLSVGYMFDADADLGSAEGYIGLVFLGGRTVSALTPPRDLRNFRMSTSGAFAQGGDPTTDAERYQCLDGTAPYSIPPPDSSTGLHPSQRSSDPDDYRILLSSGAFGDEANAIAPGDSIAVQFGLVVGRGFEGMIDSAVMLKLLYDGAWFDHDADPRTGVLGRETPVCGSRFAGRQVRLDGCDVGCDGAPSSDPNCYGTVPDSGCVWVNLDCELERYVTPTGTGGAEHVVRWLHPAWTPVELEDLQAWARDDGVRLAWRFAADSWPQFLSVGVQRARAAGGPFATLTVGLVPEVTMSWIDHDAPTASPLWYRLVVENHDGSREVTRAIAVATTSKAALELFAPVDGGHREPVAIRYRVGSCTAARLEIFDVAGRRIRSFDEGTIQPGAHTCLWDRRSQTGAPAATGLYFVRLHAESQWRTRRLWLRFD